MSRDDEDLDAIDLDEYEDEDDYEEDDDYDYGELTGLNDNDVPVFDFRDSQSSESEDGWGFQDEEEPEEEDDEYEYDYDEDDDLVEEYNSDSDGDTVEYYSDDEYDEEYEVDEDYEDDYEDDYELDSHESAKSAPVRPTERPERDLGVVDSKSKSNPLNSDIDEDEVDLEADKEKDGDGEPIFEKLFGAIKDRNISIDLSFYDKAMSAVLTKLSALPVVGKLFALFTKSKNVLRLFPLILIVLIYGICFVFSMITGVDKTSTVELPDNGEVTLTTVAFYKDTNNIIFEAENTGGVINPFEVEDMKLYTYSPGLNPLSWAKFKEIGTCSLPENSVEDTAELLGICELKEGEKAALNTRAIIVENED